MPNKPSQYRLNVACVVINSTGQILACRRVDKNHSWQLPQGGVDTGETLEEAAWRELQEEIGTNDAEMLGSLTESEKYEWPEDLYSRGYLGQEQFFFLFKLRDSAVINLSISENIEFDAYQWLSPDEFLKLITDFRRTSYVSGLTKLALIYPHYLPSPDFS